MNGQDFKHAGLCSLCNKTVFEVIRTWPEGHPWAKLPRQLGAPLPEARRVYLVLLWSGRLAPVTLCGDCQITQKELPTLWKRCMEATARPVWDVNLRAALGLQPVDPRQVHRLKTTLAIQMQDRPVGVLCEQRWTEVGDNGRTGA